MAAVTSITPYLPDADGRFAALTDDQSAGE
jgi:hypothetical protein